ncbi:hypothetical protein BURMUCGD1_0898 [Burkholderia multivorans CGD1]|nr:hypothetical protein BURMUCGD1_0898 [Burkholderia multivorans CGD1]
MFQVGMMMENMAVGFGGRRVGRTALHGGPQGAAARGSPAL